MQIRGRNRHSQIPPAQMTSRAAHNMQCFCLMGKCPESAEGLGGEASDGKCDVVRH